MGGVAGPSFGLGAPGGLDRRRGGGAADPGRATAARALRVVSAWGIAAVHASLGDLDETFEWLETAITEHAPGMILLRAHPRFDAIRGDPRYWPIVERVGVAGKAS